MSRISRGHPPEQALNALAHPPSKGDFFLFRVFRASLSLWGVAKKKFCNSTRLLVQLNKCCDFFLDLLGVVIGVPFVEVFCYFLFGHVFGACHRIY